jgi:lipopolysaccharide export system protein LptA
LLISPGFAAEEVLPQLPKNQFRASALLPPGSELKDVMFPSYDDRHALVSVLKAKMMTFVSPQQIAADEVSVQFYNPDQSQRGRIDLAQALMDREKGLLRSDDPLEIQYDRMTSTGTGLRYFFEQHEGFLLGPVTTRIRQVPPKKTTMKASSSKLPATAALGMTLLAQPLAAAPPPPMTAQEKAAIQADAAPMAPAAAAAVAETQAKLKADLAASQKASDAAASLLDQAGLPATSPGTFAPATQPLDIPAAPTDMVIDGKGGFYFDDAEGVFVYLKNVTVKDPSYNLSGANELKVFVGKKAPKPKDAKDPKAKKPSMENSLGDVERIVATGAIRVVKEASEGQERVEASAAVFTYNAKAEQLILTGGYPWVKQGEGKQRLVAQEPNAILRINLKPYKVVAEGHWITVFDPKQKP